MITDTEFALSSNKKALERRRMEEEAIIFKEKIRKNLAGQRKRLILTEEGLEIL
jgi:hypothetical protein